MSGRPLSLDAMVVVGAQHGSHGHVVKVAGGRLQQLFSSLYTSIYVTSIVYRENLTKIKSKRGRAGQEGTLTPKKGKHQPTTLFRQTRTFSRSISPEMETGDIGT